MVYDGNFIWAVQVHSVNLQR